MLALGAALGAPCALDGPADAPFAVGIPTDAGTVQVVVVLRVGDASDVPWAEGVLGALEARGLRAGLSHRATTPDPAVGELLRAALARGHQAVVRLETPELPTDTVSGPGQLRRHVAPLRKVTGPLDAAEAPLGDRASEAVMQRVGMHAVLETNGPASATPRRQLHLEARPDVGVVLPAGPYAGPCGDGPQARGLTPAAADRITQAIWGARGTEPGVVRVTLVNGSPDDAGVLGRWIDGIARPAGVALGPPRDARVRALKALRANALVGTARPPALGGRLVHLDEVRRAAEGLRDVRAIPRMLPGDLTPTEAWLAFLLVLADRTEGSVVRLGALEGPSLRAAPLPRSREIPASSLRSLAIAVLDDGPARVPASLPVDGAAVPAPELLIALAAAVRGEDPAVARPVDVPDPNATGLGWGAATTP